MRFPALSLSFLKSQQRSRLACFILISLLGSPLILCAQEDDADVHIAPRHSSPKHATSADDAARSVLGTDAATLFTKRVNLVLIPVTITDGTNHLVMGLNKDDFQVFERGTEQRITEFSSEDAPISLGVLFDTSGSMAPKMETARKAIVEFFKTSNPLDDMFVITFAYDARLLQDFTSDVKRIQKELATVPATGRTTLLDAIDGAIRHIRKGKYQRKALLIISDGGDNHSRHTEFEIRDLVQESEVQVYAIAITENARTEEERLGPRLLSEIASVSGGNAFPIHDVSQLPRIAERIALELRSQYVLGYKPTTSTLDGKWHEVQVKLSPSAGSKPLRVYSKSGYYSHER